MGGGGSEGIGEAGLKGARSKYIEESIDVQEGMGWIRGNKPLGVYSHKYSVLRMQ